MTLPLPPGCGWRLVVHLASGDVAQAWFAEVPFSGTFCYLEFMIE